MLYDAESVEHDEPWHEVTNDAHDEPCYGELDVNIMTHGLVHDDQEGQRLHDE